MKTRLWCFAAAYCLGLVISARADDWPQWRGPDHNDISKESGLLKAWPKDGPKLLWKYKDAGAGFSSPAIVGDRLYCMGGDGNNDFVFALDIKEKGKKLWSKQVGPFFKNGNGDGPRGAPAVDGDLLYVLTAQGELICLETSQGDKKWQLSLKQELGGEMMSGWGYSESPLVDGDKIICTPGGPKGTLAAVDKKTGKLLWQSKEIKDKAANSSAVPMTVGGIHQYVQMTGNSVFGVAADDGRLLWRVERSGPVAAVPTPIVHDNYVYATSGYNAQCTLIKLTPEGKGIKAEKEYSNKNMENQHGGVVLVDGHIFGHWGSNDERPHRWVCQDFLTGEVTWEEKKKGDPGSSKLEKGSITYADGHLYLFSEKTGTAVLLQASTKGWKEDGRFTIPHESKVRNKGRIWTHPVVANGDLFLRDQDILFCYDIKASNSTKR